MNKPSSFPPKESLLERASEVFDFGAALRGKGLPPISAPAEPLPETPVTRQTPEATAEQPAPSVAPAPAAPANPAEQIAPAVPVAPAAPAEPAMVVPAPAPIFRARDWKAPAQPLDRAAMAEAGYLVPDGPVCGLSEEFRIVKRELLTSIRGSRQEAAWPNGNVILVTSAHSGDGKTFCSINLAVSLAAESDLEVLLVDADFAKPSIVRALGLQADKGFMDALIDPALPVEQCVIPTDVPSLFILPSGQSTNRDAEHLASARMESVIAGLVAGRPNRVVLFDSPPLLAASPAAVLAAHVGQTLFVVRADRTTESALRDAGNLLRGCGHIRLLLNGVQFSSSGRRYGSYYGKEAGA